MGRSVTVKTGFTGVFLPNTFGFNSSFNAGDTTILTNAEWAALATVSPGAFAALTDNGNAAEPVRPTNDKFAEPITNVAQFTATTGGAVQNGVNIVTGPAAGVTYAATGFLAYPYDNNSVFPAVVGSKTGGQTELEVYHIQGAVVSVAPVAKQWIYYRQDAAAVTTNASPVVADAAITAADFGRPVAGTNIPASSFVGTVIPGVSFRISSSATTQTDANATGSGTVTATIGSVVKWPAGTVPTFTASVGAIDYFKFLSPDGGFTWYNVLTVKGLA